ncbi:MAG: glutamate synthase-related protein [Verrucomicrobiales bacterium]
MPFKVGFTRVYHALVEHGIHEQIAFVGSGKLGFPEQALFAFAMGCDLVAVAREAMLSIGCIQAQRCHTGHCPAGIATHHPWLMRGLDPALKAARLANYLVTLRYELLKLSRTCGVPHPAMVTPEHFDILSDQFSSRPAREVFGYAQDLVPMPCEGDRRDVVELMARLAA